MADPVTSAGVETLQDFGGGSDAPQLSPADYVRYWNSEIKLAQREEQGWQERARKVVQRYRDEREASEEGQGRFNVLWSNVETQGPLIYSQVPKPVVARRFPERKADGWNPFQPQQPDEVSRIVSELLERAITVVLDTQMDGVMKRVRQDFLLPGRGEARVRYVPTFKQIPLPPVPTVTDATGRTVRADTGEAIEDTTAIGDNGFWTPPPLEALDTERVELGYTVWDDVLFSPAPTWEDVRWVAFRARMTRDQLTARFGDVGKQVPLKNRPAGMEKDVSKPENELFARAIVWEIWDKTSGKALWIAEGFADQTLDEKPDPLRLQQFFPCPEPVQALWTNGTLKPAPEYCQYQDQAQELDDLTDKIRLITRAIRVKGFYAGDSKNEFSTMFADGNDAPELIAWSDWAAFTDSGGLEKLIAWFPIDMLVAALTALYQARQEVKQELYEVSGLADIIRGASNPDETATAQNIKSRFAGMRVEDKAKQMARFARDLVRLTGEIIAEHFQPKTLSEMTGIYLPTAAEKQAALLKAQMMMANAGAQGQPADPTMAAKYQALQAQPTWDDVLPVLRSDVKRSFRIDIETDTTIAPDKDAEKQARVEFLEAFSQFLSEVAPLVGQGVIPFELAKEMLLFGVRGFPIARPLEAAIEAMQPQAPQNQGPSPEQIRADSAQQVAQIRAQSEQAKLEGQQQLEAIRQHGAAQIEALRTKTEGLIETMRMAFDADQNDKDRALQAQGLLIKAGTAPIKEPNGSLDAPAVGYEDAHPAQPQDNPALKQATATAIQGAQEHAALPPSGQ
jgi:hypothetical protein